MEQKYDLGNYRSNKHIKSNFKPLIPVEGATILGKQAVREEDHKMEKQPTKAKKTRKEKASQHLQKNLNRSRGPSKSVFQTSVLPAIGKTGSVTTSNSNGPDLIKPCKVHPIDFDPKESKRSDSKYSEVFNKPNNQMTSVEFVPGPAEHATPVIDSTGPPMRLHGPRSEGLISSRHNKVHPETPQTAPGGANSDMTTSK